MLKETLEWDAGCGRQTYKEVSGSLLGMHPGQAFFDLSTTIDTKMLSKHEAQKILFFFKTIGWF